VNIGTEIRGRSAPFARLLTSAATEASRFSVVGVYVEGDRVRCERRWTSADVTPIRQHWTRENPNSADLYDVGRLR
jgi:hypothetical protein